MFNILAEGADQITPDLSLIRNWDLHFYQNHPYQPFPKIIQFDGKHTLTFVATKHSDWKNSQAKIEFAIKTFKPKIILIEGIAKANCLSPRVWDDKLKANLNVDGFEDYYAYKIAIESKIPFVGAELEGKMSDHSSFERDVAVVNYLGELLMKYHNVMVIYGAGHFVQQESCLVKMLGKSRSIE